MKIKRNNHNYNELGISNENSGRIRYGHYEPEIYERLHLSLVQNYLVRKVARNLMKFQSVFPSQLRKCPSSF